MQHLSQSRIQLPQKTRQADKGESSISLMVWLGVWVTFRRLTSPANYDFLKTSVHRNIAIMSNAIQLRAARLLRAILELCPEYPGELRQDIHKIAKL
jgi:hypothetical protein